VRQPNRSNMEWADKLWWAIALMLILEGGVLLLAPTFWRQVYTQFLQLRDGQLRFYGLSSMLLGMLGVALLAF